jgi:hypothetical protein
MAGWYNTTAISTAIWREGGAASCGRKGGSAAAEAQQPERSAAWLQAMMRRKVSDIEKRIAALEKEEAELARSDRRQPHDFEQLPRPRKRWKM